MQKRTQERQNEGGGERVIAYLGLGANLGDRKSSIIAALNGLHSPPIIEVTTVSSLYETAPVGVTDQPDFLNAVAEIRTSLTPPALLEAALRLEKSLGRLRTERWGARVIDIDVLLYGDRQIAAPGLVVPHPRLYERAFALVPLAEVAPDVVLPGTGGQTARKKAETVPKVGNISRVGVVDWVNGYPHLR